MKTSNNRDTLNFKTSVLIIVNILHIFVFRKQNWKTLKFKFKMTSSSSSSLLQRCMLGFFIYFFKTEKRIHCRKKLSSLKLNSKKKTYKKKILFKKKPVFIGVRVWVFFVELNSFFFLFCKLQVDIVSRVQKKL